MFFGPSTALLNQQRSRHHAQPPGSTGFSLWSLSMVLSFLWACTNCKDQDSDSALQAPLPPPSACAVNCNHLIVLRLSEMLVPHYPLGQIRCAERQLHGTQAGQICFFSPMVRFHVAGVVSRTHCSIYFGALWPAWFLQVMTAIISGLFLNVIL